MSNKTISINPSLFSIKSLKTKKNRGKKVPTNIPLISPNVLKKKLLNRIKEHKNKEIKNTNAEKKIDNSNLEKIDELFSDEFNESINYLQTLTKQKKINEEKERFEKKKQIQKEELERRTVKNYHSLNHSINEPFVNIELPSELNEQLVKVNTEQLNIISPGMPLKPYNIDNIPYGILKGGRKPTYRNWSKNNNDTSISIHDSSINKKKVERENRLNNLREKLKNKQNEQLEDNNIQSQNLFDLPLIKENIANENIANENIANENISNQNIGGQNISNQNIGGQNISNENISKKRIIKKTIKKKYTLGKSKIKKMVSILVKDRKSRKQIINAEKDLKKKSINDVKNYLRDHNLIKIGSNAPNDVIRKLYESAILAGDITNSNTETLLHNLSKNDKEL
jgi:hypothetical protein